MADKFTPGPWIVCGRTTVYALNEQGTNRFSASVQSAGQKCEADEEECAANARLMATAPDLLEACRAALPFLGGGQHFELHSGKEALDAVRAAISRATGAVP